MIIRKSLREIDKIAAAGALVAETIAHVGSQLAPGVTTDELDAVANDFIRERGGIPTSAGYKGYPKAICISPNDVVVHGIPGAFEVSDGDLVTIDVGVTLAARDLVDRGHDQEEHQLFVVEEGHNGGPEMVVTEYKKPSPVPKGRPTSRSDRIGLLRPAAWTRIRGRRTV